MQNEIYVLLVNVVVHEKINGCFFQHIEILLVLRPLNLFFFTISNDVVVVVLLPLVLCILCHFLSMKCNKGVKCLAVFYKIDLFI